MSNTTLKDRHSKLLSQRDLIKLRVDESIKVLEEHRRQKLDIDVVQQILQTTSAQIQNEYGDYIGDIVTKAIHHVFPERITDRFIVRFRENRGQTECQLLIRSKSENELHPFHCSGGGVWDVIAFALRCIVVVLEKPQRSRFMLCDEPFKNLHGKEQRAAALQMLHNTCKNMSIQCIAIHQSDVNGSDEEVLEALSEDGAYVYRVELVSYENSKIERVV